MPKQKDRVIIDTNLWTSFLISKDYSKLGKILSDKLAIFLYSQELIDEFIEVAQRPKFKRYFGIEDLQALLLTMNDRAILLALAKDGKATHLITGDKDLLVLKNFGKTQILTIAEYLN